MLATLLSEFLPYLLAAGAAIAALVGFGARQKFKGRKEAEIKAREADNEIANDIRNRVDDADSVMHEYDDAGFRDE